MFLVRHSQGAHCEAHDAETAQRLRSGVLRASACSDTYALPRLCPELFRELQIASAWFGEPCARQAHTQTDLPGWSRGSAGWCSTLLL